MSTGATIKHNSMNTIAAAGHHHFNCLFWHIVVILLLSALSFTAFFPNPLRAGRLRFVCPAKPANAIPTQHDPSLPPLGTFIKQVQQDIRWLGLPSPPESSTPLMIYLARSLAVSTSQLSGFWVARPSATILRGRFQLHKIKKLAKSKLALQLVVKFERVAPL